MRDAASLAAATEKLRRHYGFRAFRPAQEAVVRAVLAGRDVLAVLPTGGGKSACFQVPALLRPGLTVVVSPLIALMEDQVEAARRRGIPAACLASTLSPSRRRRTEADLRAGCFKLLYVSPERLESPRFRRLVGSRAVSLLAVDEAHCISEWGHDFRPSYRRIDDFRRFCRSPPAVALTATATARTRADIEEALGLRDPVRVIRAVDRSNLRWSARRVPSLAEGALLALRRVRQEPGAAIVYVPTRRRATRLAQAFRRRGSAAAAYHAGLAPERRTRVQEAFLGGEIRVVCATGAFGMGVDHGAVRIVCHLGLPGSLEACEQEAGRAGRDGRPARCLLLACPGDVRLQRALIRRAWPSPRTLDRVWAALPPGRGVRASELRPPGRGRRLGEQEIAVAFRLLVEFGCAREVSAGPVAGPGPGVESDSVAGPGPDVRALLADASSPAPEGVWSPAVVRAPGPLRRRLDFSAPRRGRRRARERLWALERYLRARRCRRASIAVYFGDPAPRCSGCDRCERFSPPSPRVS
ncbi:MAG: RecQ family ATP-dependent DNA helicase [Gemmatimonadota bacterium]